jgi:hypothetical protein
LLGRAGHFIIGPQRQRKITGKGSLIAAPHLHSIRWWFGGDLDGFS